MGQLLAVLIDGLIYSSWLFIIAVGLTLIYGVMKILNIAHGSLYALGAYSAASLAGSGSPPWLSTPSMRLRWGKAAWRLGISLPSTTPSRHGRATRQERRER